MSESIREVPTFVARDAALPVRLRAARPTAREWRKHSAFFLLTALTMTWAGISFMLPPDKVEPVLADPASPLEYLLYIPKYYVLALAAEGTYALAHPYFIGAGLTFAAALLSILLAHESGHYVACRLYGVDATLPFFIPVPPPFIAGTLGAFIKIRSPIPTRRALFDIGVAGPLAGFVIIIPVACLALLTSAPAPPLPAEGVIYFNDPLLLRLLAVPLGVRDLAGMAPNPFYFAAWIGLLVTSLNLLPVGQLDGGHAVYSVFGRRVHKYAGRIAFLSMLALAPLGWLWHGVPSFLYVILLFIMLRLPHPQPLDERDALGPARMAVALATLFVFVLSFVLFPITIR